MTNDQLLKTNRVPAQTYNSPQYISQKYQLTDQEDHEGLLYILICGQYISYFSTYNSH